MSQKLKKFDFLKLEFYRNLSSFEKFVKYLEKLNFEILMALSAR